VPGAAIEEPVATLADLEAAERVFDRWWEDQLARVREHAA
jgi:hypothetical protein